MNEEKLARATIAYRLSPNDNLYYMVKNRKGTLSPRGLGYYDIRNECALYLSGSQQCLLVSDYAEWWLNAKGEHREGAPAIVHRNGSSFWYINGKLHREDGPAIIRCSDSGEVTEQEWWLRGKRVSEKDTINLTNKEGRARYREIVRKELDAISYSSPETTTREVATGDIVQEGVLASVPGKDIKDRLIFLSKKLSDVTINIADYNDLLSFPQTIDPISVIEVLQTGLYGTIDGMNIWVSRDIPRGEYYAGSTQRLHSSTPMSPSERYKLPEPGGKYRFVGIENCSENTIWFHQKDSHTDFFTYRESAYPHKAYLMTMDTRTFLEKSRRVDNVLSQVAMRVLVNQGAEATRNAISSLLSDRGRHKNHVSSFLNTDFGKTLTLMLFGAGIGQMKNHRAVAVASECRVQSLTLGGNAIIDSVVSSIAQLPSHGEIESILSEDRNESDSRLSVT